MEQMCACEWLKCRKLLSLFLVWSSHRKRTDSSLEFSLDFESDNTIHTKRL